MRWGTGWLSSRGNSFPGDAFLESLAQLRLRRADKSDIRIASVNVLQGQGSLDRVPRSRVENLTAPGREFTKDLFWKEHPGLHERLVDKSCQDDLLADRRVIIRQFDAALRDNRRSRKAPRPLLPREPCSLAFCPGTWVRAPLSGLPLFSWISSGVMSSSDPLVSRSKRWLRTSTRAFSRMAACLLLSVPSRSPCTSFSSIRLSAAWAHRLMTPKSLFSETVLVSSLHVDPARPKAAGCSGGLPSAFAKQRQTGRARQLLPGRHSCGVPW